MYTPVNVIQVYAWGEFVGALALDPRLGFYAFEYDPRWRRTGRELAPLQMPGRASPYVFPSLPVETFQRLPALSFKPTAVEVSQLVGARRWWRCTLSRVSCIPGNCRPIPVSRTGC